MLGRADLHEPWDFLRQLLAPRSGVDGEIPRSPVERAVVAHLSGEEVRTRLCESDRVSGLGYDDVEVSAEVVVDFAEAGLEIGVLVHG